MAIRYPSRPEDEEIHGEQQPKAPFGPDYNPDTMPASNPTNPRTSPDELRGREENLSQPSAENIDSKEKGLAGSDAGSSHDHIGYNPSDKFSTASSRLGRVKHKLKRNKKKVAAGGIVGTVTGVSFLGLGIISGPLQLIHLAQTLSKSFSIQNLKTEPRMKGMVRYMWTGDYGETRVGLRQSHLANRTANKMRAIGVEVQLTERSGVNSHRFNTADPDSKFRKFAGMSDADIKRDMGFRPDDPDVKIDRSRNHVSVRAADPATTKGQRINAQVNNFAGRQLNSGMAKVYTSVFGSKIGTAMHMRHFKAKYGVARMFHPLEKRTGAAKEKVLRALGRPSAAADIEKNDRGKARTDATKPAAKTAGSKINKSQVRGMVTAAAVTSVSLGNELACYVKGKINDIIVFNSAAIVVPSLIEAQDKLAVGNQIMAGEDFDMEQAGIIVESFRDENGEDIWQSEDLNAIAKNGIGVKGEGLDAEYLQAFVVGRSGVPEEIVNIQKIADDISHCKWYERATGFVLGAGLAIASGGTSTFFKTLVTAKTAKSALKFTGVLILLGKIADEFKTDLAVEPPLQGPQGGSLLAYGSRAAASESARTKGGVALSEEEENRYMDRIAQLDHEEMKNKSFFARTFDVYDHRSLASQAFIQKTSPSPSQNINNIASGFMGIGSSLISNLAGFLPKVSAQEERHIFVDSAFGIPDEVLSDSRLDDPYKNIHEAGNIIKNHSKYKSKAEKCFGVEISSDDKGLLVKPKDQTDPNSSEYADAKCEEGLLGSGHDLNWRRVVMAVHDYPLLEVGACLEDDDEACSNLGIENVGSGDTTTDTGSGVSGNAQELAQKLLDLAKEGKIIFGHNDFGNDSADNSNPDENLRDLADGKEARTTQSRGCTGGAVNAPNSSTRVSANLLKFLVDLAKNGNTVRVNSIAGQCHSATSNHYKGLAVDLGCAPDPGKAKLDEAAQKYGGKNNGEVCPGNHHYHYDFNK